MKVCLKQVRQIIKEELQNLLNENETEESEFQKVLSKWNRKLKSEPEAWNREWQQYMDLINNGQIYEGVSLINDVPELLMSLFPRVRQEIEFKHRKEFFNQIVSHKNTKAMLDLYGDSKMKDVIKFLGEEGEEGVNLERAMLTIARDSALQKYLNLWGSPIDHRENGWALHFVGSEDWDNAGAMKNKNKFLNFIKTHSKGQIIKSPMQSFGPLLRIIRKPQDNK